MAPVAVLTVTPEHVAPITIAVPARMLHL